MSDIETLVTAPVVIAIIAGSQVVLRGRQGGEDVMLSTPLAPTAPVALPVDPMLMLCGLAAFLFTGACLVAIEMRAERLERRERLSLRQPT